MSENFIFNAPQFVDFSNGMKEEDIKNAEAYFDEDHEQSINEINVKQIASERDVEEELFFSARQSPYQTSMAEKCLQNNLRKSMSTGNIFLLINHGEEIKEEDLDCEELLRDFNVDKQQKADQNASSENKQASGKSRRSGTKSTKLVRARSASTEKLSQPKQVNGMDSYHSVAETVLNFEKGFRSERNVKPFHIHTTIPQSPALKTKQRVRPTEVMSKDELEKKQLEEAKKYRIKAKPLNTKLLHGPVKPQKPVVSKPPTVVEPFKITVSNKQAKTNGPQEVETYKFVAKPVPKSIYNPPKIPPRCTSPVTLASPKPVSRLQKHRSLDHVDRCSNTSLDNVVKQTKTQPLPFSFDDRDKQLKKKKEEFINRVLEEEKKAREFHARPPPKFLQQASQPQNNRVIVKRSSSHGDIKKNNPSTENVHSASPPVFKARPASVLYVKPFEPKLETKPLTEITEFHLNTDRRAKEREAFDEHLKKQQERIEQMKKEEEERRLAEEQKEIAMLRKQTEIKANPVRQYKELVIKKSDKITVPISPKFAVESRLQNKENVHQAV